MLSCLYLSSKYSEGNTSFHTKTLASQETLTLEELKAIHNYLAVQQVPIEFQTVLF